MNCRRTGSIITTQLNSALTCGGWFLSDRHSTNNRVSEDKTLPAREYILRLVRQACYMTFREDSAPGKPATTLLTLEAGRYALREQSLRLRQHDLRTPILDGLHQATSQTKERRRVPTTPTKCAGKCEGQDPRASGGGYGVLVAVAVWPRVRLF